MTPFDVDAAYLRNYLRTIFGGSGQRFYHVYRDLAFVKHLPNILPGVAALVGQVIMASIWAYNAHHAYFKTFLRRPQLLFMIPDVVWSS